jgi:hypothetical protein
VFGVWLLWIKIFCVKTVLEIGSTIDDEYKTNMCIVEKCSSLEERSFILTVVKPLFLKK